jgi:hypothetical protein
LAPCFASLKTLLAVFARYAWVALLLKHNATTYLPVKLKTVKIRKRFFNYLLITDGEKILMNKRNDGDIWAICMTCP